jgi:hypothetical protein
LRSCAGPGANIWLLAHPIFLYFVYLKMFSLLHCALGWVFPILYSLGCRTTFVASLWILWGCTFFTAHMVWRRQLHMMLCNMFLWPLREIWDFMFHKSKPMSFCSLSFSFCVVELRLYYQLMVFAHWQMLSSLIPFKLIYFTNCSFLRGCGNSYKWNKGWFLLWSVPNIHVFLFSDGGIQMSTLVIRRVFSLMCQHGVGSEGHWRPSSLSFAHIL